MNEPRTKPASAFVTFLCRIIYSDFFPTCVHNWAYWSIQNMNLYTLNGYEIYAIYVRSQVHYMEKFTFCVGCTGFCVIGYARNQNVDMISVFWQERQLNTLNIKHRKRDERKVTAWKTRILCENRWFVSVAWVFFDSECEMQPTKEICQVFQCTLRTSLGGFHSLVCLLFVCRGRRGDIRKGFGWWFQLFVELQAA